MRRRKLWSAVTGAELSLSASLRTLDSAIRHVHTHLRGSLDGVARHDPHPVVKSGRHDLLAVSIDFKAAHTLRSVAGDADRELGAVVGRDGQIPDWILL